MIVPVWVSSKEYPTKETLTYAILDTQSNATFVLEEIARSVTGRCTPVRLKLATMTSSSCLVDTYAVSELMVRGISSSKRIKIPTSYTRDFIPYEQSQVPTRETTNAWPHLKGITDEMAALQGCGVGILIGYNCPQALIPRETITGRDDEPYAIKTDLGWSIVGGDNSSSRVNTVCHRMKVKELPEVSPRDVLKVLQTDFADNQDEDKTVSQEDLRFIATLQSGIKQTNNGHYIMPLPFKSGSPCLPNNRRTAFIRLNHLKKKFQTNSDYYHDYQDVHGKYHREG